MSVRWLGVLAVLGCCVVLFAAPLRAETEREVRVMIAADSANARDLKAVFVELLTRLHVSLVVTRVAAIEPAAIASPGATENGVLTRVWVDLTKPGAAILYLLDVRSDRVLVRKVRRTPDGAELVREELGHILQTSVEGLLAGETVGVPRQEILPLLEPDTKSTEPAKPAPIEHAPTAPVEAERSSPNAPGHGWLRGRATLLYAAGLLASEATFTHGPELGFFALANGHIEPGLWLSLQWRLPVQVAEGPVSARFSQFAPRGLFTAKLVGNSERALRLGIGAGADVVRVETSLNADAEVDILAPRTHVFAIARAAFLLDWRLSGALRLVGALTIDADGSGARYVFSTRAGERALLEPYALRPALALGIAVP
ncbi:MAG: hypothetical protein ACOY0T_12915 [Myxococcota bacterium]